MRYKVYTTPEFDHLLSKLPKDDQEAINDLMKNELPINPYQGKPLGFKFLREKKIRNRRVYFLIYDDYVLVLMVAIGDKKTQTKDINQIKSNREEFLRLTKEIFKQPF